MMKKCKQCGKQLVDEMFRKYYPRGTGQRKTTSGRNTVCITCERLNATVTRAWKKTEGRTVQEEELLTQAAKYYKKLVADGNEPIGVYAKHVCGGGAAPKKSSTEYSLELMTGVLQEPETDNLLVEYDRLLGLELTDNPDVYQTMLDELRTKCLGDNHKVLPKYASKLEEVAKKFDDYEDGYVW